MPSSLNIETFVLGQLQNNTYLLSDAEKQRAVIIDPAAGIETVIEEIKQHSLQLSAIWVTHAHFDHITGVNQLLQACGDDTPIYLHPADLALWESGGGASNFCFHLELNVKPTDFFHHGQILKFGESELEVRHTPGHSPGSIMLYWQEKQTAFCGDLIFYHSVGRTDLPYGDEEALLHSIREQVLTLPDPTALLCGHGPSTTVGEERTENPFLQY